MTQTLLLNGQTFDDRDVVTLESRGTREGNIRGYGQQPVQYPCQAARSTMIAEVSASLGRTIHNTFKQTFEIAQMGLFLA